VNYSKFEIAFWHPFGPHGDEDTKEIIERKCKEIVANKWTLWSFRHRLMLEDWHRELLSAKQNAIFVFCSDSPSAVDPAREGSLSKPINCQSFRYVWGQIYAVATDAARGQDSPSVSSERETETGFRFCRPANHIPG